jgi:hypothetical protein
MSHIFTLRNAVIALLAFAFFLIFHNAMGNDARLLCATDPTASEAVCEQAED